MARIHGDKKSLKKISRRKKRQAAVVGAIMAVSAAVTSALSISASPTPKNTSILTGQAWVQELLTGHPSRIHEQLGISKHVFIKLLNELTSNFGLDHSRYVTALEQLAIFLYLGHTGLGSRMIQERFQRSGATISHYIHKMTKIFAGPFYAKYVTLMPDHTPVEILNNPKLSPYFDDNRGTMDGVHFNTQVSACDIDRYRNWKGHVSQNVLACSDYKLRFIYVLSGWEGSAADSRVFDYARRSDLQLPPGQYFLADAGFPLCDLLMTPYRGVQYHLKEWGRGNQKPQTPEELFNLRHAQARNVVERIFGVFKRRFRITESAPEYSSNMQAKFIPAFAAIHNFVHIHDPSNDIQSWTNDGKIAQHEPEQPASIQMDHLAINITAEERNAASDRRDAIAKKMWEDYQRILEQQN